MSSELDPEDPTSHDIYRYEIDFKATCSDVQFVQEGGYIELTDAERDRFLPEGGAGDLAYEFEANKKTAWMVRNSSKLLCRFIYI